MHVSILLELRPKLEIRLRQWLTVKLQLRVVLSVRMRVRVTRRCEARWRITASQRASRSIGAVQYQRRSPWTHCGRCCSRSLGLSRRLGQCLPLSHGSPQDQHGPWWTSTCRYVELGMRWLAFRLPRRRVRFGCSTCGRVGHARTCSGGGGHNKDRGRVSAAPGEGLV